MFPFVLNRYKCWDEFKVKTARPIWSTPLELGTLLDSNNVYDMMLVVAASSANNAQIKCDEVIVKSQL